MRNVQKYILDGCPMHNLTARCKSSVMWNSKWNSQYNLCDGVWCRTNKDGMLSSEQAIIEENIRHCRVERQPESYNVLYTELQLMLASPGHKKCSIAINCNYCHCNDDA